MGLQDLNESLYKRDGVSRPSDRNGSFNLRNSTGENNAAREAFRADGTWNAPRVSFMDRHKKTIVRGSIVAAVVVAAALAYAGFVRIRQSAFTSDRVTMQVDGPSEVSGSDSSSFTFIYANDNRAELTNVELMLNYPESFRPDAVENMTISGSSSQVHIGTIAGHSQGKIEVRGRFSGSKGSLAYIKGTLKYKPANASSFFQAESQLGVTIQSPSIRLSVDAPLQVADGQVVEYRLDYANMSGIAFDHLRLKAEYPDGFHPTQSDPKASEGDSVWYIGNLAPGQSGSVHIAGTMDGSKNEAKVIKAHMGLLQGNGDLLSYSDSDRLTTIVASPLSVQQTVNGLNQANVSPGGTLSYAVRYRNDSEIGLRNVIVTLEIQGSVLDYSKIQSNGGSFDENRKTVTWKASDVRDLANLAPGKEGSVSVSIPVVGNLPVKTDTDKNFTITSVAKIDSPDISTPTGANKIIGSNTLRVKVGSGVSIQSLIAYQDTAIPNTGPATPTVGQETTFTLHWGVTNGTNDLDKATATAYLPTGVRWTGKTSPSSENLSYNERTNQITWNIGNIQSSTGSLRPARDVAFQVGITPQINQAGQSVPVLGEANMTAHDTFTDENLQSKAGAQSVTVGQ